MKSGCVGEVPDVAYALSFIVSLPGVSALEAYHRFLDSSYGWWQLSVLPS